jgi:micrococcal nuclease
MHRAFRIACLAAAAASLAGLFGMAAATAQEERTDAESCTLQAGPTRSVVRVIDSETVLLDDHQEVRLIGALAPRSPDFSPGAEPWPPEEAAIAALKALVQGRSVSIASSGRARDRYGRQLAHLFVEDGSERA